jgi:hypothetical protein
MHSSVPKQVQLLDTLRRRRNPKPAWVHQTKGVLWRLVPSDTDVFVGEERDLGAKRASFFCLNRSTGEILWTNVPFNEPWWIGIEAVHRDRLFLHGFTQPDMPEHLGVLAVDLFTGQIAWSRNDVRFVLVTDESLFASKDTVNGRSILELHPQDGSTLGSWDNDHEGMQMARSRRQVVLENEPEFPAPIADDELITFVSKHAGIENSVGVIEGLAASGFYFFNYHQRSVATGQLSSVLFATDRTTGGIVFKETLDQNLQGVVSDSFFLWDEKLFFIKDRHMLTAVNIPDFSR